MKMKKALALVLAALLLVSMAACTGTAPAATTAATTAAAAETAAETEASEASAETESGKTYTVGICQLVQHPALDAATQGFKDALTEALGDAVSFNEQNASGESVNCATIVNGLVASQVDLDPGQRHCPPAGRCLCHCRYPCSGHRRDGLRLRPGN